MKKGFLGVILSMTGVITTATGFIVLNVIDGINPSNGACYNMMFIGALLFGAGIMLVFSIEEDKEKKSKDNVTRNLP